MCVVDDLPAGAGVGQVGNESLRASAGRLDGIPDREQAVQRNIVQGDDRAGVGECLRQHTADGTAGAADEDGLAGKRKKIGGYTHESAPWVSMMD
ncbi:MAG: hypothetical protein QM739_16645 [Propionivibrio sp.]